MKSSVSFFPKLSKKHNSTTSLSKKPVNTQKHNSIIDNSYFRQDQQNTDRNNNDNFNNFKRNNISNSNSSSQQKINLKSGHNKVNDSLNNSELIVNNQNNYARSLFQSYNGTKSQVKPNSNNNLENKLKEIDVKYQTDLGKTIIFTPGNVIPNRDKFLGRKSSQKFMQLSTKTELYKADKNFKSELANEMEKQNHYLREEIKNKESAIQQLELQVKELQTKNNSQRENIEILILKNNSNLKNQDIQAKLKELEQTINKLQIENKHLKSTKINLDQKLKNAEKESSLYLNNCKSMQEQIQKKQEQIDKLNNENQKQENIRKKSISKQLKTAKSQEIEEMENLQKQNQKLKTQNELLQDTVKDIKQEINIFYEIKPTRQELLQKIDQSDVTIDNLEQKLEQYQSQNQQINNDFENLKKVMSHLESNNKIELKQKINKVQKEKQLLREDIHNMVNHMQNIKENFQQKSEALLHDIMDLQDKQKQLNETLTCSFCKDILLEPVTVIPCGHSYCKKKCKEGYKSECKECGSETKVEAVYRNELFDEIIKIQKSLGGLNQKLNNICQLPQIFENIQNFSENLEEKSKIKSVSDISQYQITNQTIQSPKSDINSINHNINNYNQNNTQNFNQNQQENEQQQ